jgi:hypothetical protein
MLSICFFVSEAAKSGFRSNNSARIQPTAHMSILEQYLVQPERTSGALYHRVVT